MQSQPTQTTGNSGFGQRRSAFALHHVDADPRVACCQGLPRAMRTSDHALHLFYIRQVRLDDVRIQPQLPGILIRLDDRFALLLIAQIDLARHWQVKHDFVLRIGLHHVTASRHDLAHRGRERDEGAFGFVVEVEKREQSQHDEMKHQRDQPGRSTIEEVVNPGGHTSFARGFPQTILDPPLRGGHRRAR